MNSPIVVTGSSGFVGSRLVKTLHYLNYDVIPIDINKSTDSNVKTFQIDISKESIEKFIPKNSQVIHLGALSTDSDCRKFPLKALEFNIIATQRILETCNKLNVNKFLFSSSEWVYPERTQITPQYETDKLYLSSLNSIYAQTKLFSEEMIKLSAKINYSILRFGIVYGPRKSPGAAPESLAFKTYNNEEISLGSFKTARNFIYVDDLIDGIYKCLKSENVAQTYNISGDTLISLEEIVKISEKIFNTSVIVKDSGGITSIRNPINQKAKNELGWQPKITLEQGLIECIREMEK